MLRVDVTQDAAQSINDFDARLKDELIERVAEIAGAPAAFLRRSRPPEVLGLWVYEYASGVIEGMRVVLLFDRWDPGAQRISLISVGRIADFESE